MIVGMAMQHNAGLIAIEVCRDGCVASLCWSPQS